MAKSKFFPDLKNGEDTADVEQVESAFSMIEQDFNDFAEIMAVSVADTRRYADTQAESALESAKQYANENIEQYRLSVAETNEGVLLVNLLKKTKAQEDNMEQWSGAGSMDAVNKTYVTNKTEETLASAQAYANELAEQDRAYTDKKVAEANKYTDTKVSALRELTVPHTTATGTSVVTLTDSLAGEKLIGCKLYGSESGVGDLDESTGKYKIPIYVRGKNVLPYPFKYQPIFMYKTENGVTSSDGGNGRIILNGTATGSGVIPVLVPSYYMLPRGKYCLSGNTDTVKVTASIKKTDGSSQFLSAAPVVFDTTDSETYTGAVEIGIRWGSGATFANAVIEPQLEFGKTATEFEPYIEPLTVTVTLDTPLGADEYIDVVNKKRVGADGTETDIEVDGELKTLESAANNVVCETENAPSKTEVSYYQDINKVLDELKNAVLAQGASV